MRIWEDFLLQVKNTGAEIKEDNYATYIQLPDTTDGLKKLLLILTDKPAPDEIDFKDIEGLEKGNTIRVWWD